MIFVDDELSFFVKNMKFLNHTSLKPWIPAFAGMTLSLLPFPHVSVIPSCFCHSLMFLSFPRKRESTFQIALSSDPASGFNSGNKITSRIVGESVKSIISRSMPMPRPPAGGIPYSSA